MSPCALPPAESVVEEEKGEGPLPLGAAVFSLGTAWTQGFLEGCMVTFMSAYLLGLGYSSDGASGLVAALFVGVVLFQIPGAMLADRLERVRILLACHLIVLTGLALLPWCTGAVALGGLLFVVGACCAALYPLGLALLGEQIPKSAMAKANASYLVWNCVGSLTGPWLTGKSIDLFGHGASFATSAASVVIVVGAWAVCQLLGTRKSELGARNSGPVERRPAA